MCSTDNQVILQSIHCHMVRSKRINVLLVTSQAEVVMNMRALSNVIDAGHQNSCLFTNKGHFASPLWVLIGVLAKFHK